LKNHSTNIVANSILYNFGRSIHDFNCTISVSWIHDFNFTNLRFQLYEFKISTEQIHDFNFTNSTHDFTIFNFTNWRWSWNCEFMESKSWIHGVKIVYWWNVPSGLCNIVIILCYCYFCGNRWYTDIYSCTSHGDAAHSKNNTS
jgi:hypothetical protein